MLSTLASGLLGLQALPAASHLLQRAAPLLASSSSSSSSSSSPRAPASSGPPASLRCALHVGPATAPSTSLPAHSPASCLRPLAEPAPDDVPDVPGFIHSTESFSALDGPGVRFLVFLQGCGMRCLFCSNPDTWELHNGHRTSSKTIAEEIRKVLPYLKHAGGVTCSGGEPLLQPDFVSALFREAHSMNLTTCIDTTGQGTKHHNWDIVLPHTDTVLFCIKHLDPVKYQQITGIKQVGAMKFAAELADRNIPYYLRYVLLPGMSDSPADIQQLIDFAKEQRSLQAIELLPYHVLGKDKWEHLGYKYPLAGMETPPKEHVHAIRRDLEDAGLQVLCDVK